MTIEVGTVAIGPHRERRHVLAADAATVRWRWPLSGEEAEGPRAQFEAWMQAGGSS